MFDKYMKIFDMSTSNNSFESVAAELYSAIREIKSQAHDLLVTETANRAMERYENIKRSKENNLTPMLPGYECAYDAAIDMRSEDSLFDALCNNYAS